MFQQLDQTLDSVFQLGLNFHVHIHDHLTVPRKRHNLNVVNIHLHVSFHRSVLKTNHLLNPVPDRNFTSVLFYRLCLGMLFQEINQDLTATNSIGNDIDCQVV